MNFSTTIRTNVLEYPIQEEAFRKIDTSEFRKKLWFTGRSYARAITFQFPVGVDMGTRAYIGHDCNLKVTVNQDFFSKTCDTKQAKVDYCAAFKCVTASSADFFAKNISFYLPSLISCLISP